MTNVKKLDMLTVLHGTQHTKHLCYEFQMQSVTEFEVSGSGTITSLQLVRFTGILYRLPCLINTSIFASIDLCQVVFTQFYLSSVVGLYCAGFWISCECLFYQATAC
jgi:hypothetical protein